MTCWTPFLQKDLTEIHEKIDSLISEISKLEKIKKGKTDNILELDKDNKFKTKKIAKNIKPWKTSLKHYLL